MLGERSAEQIKLDIASAYPMQDEPQAEVRGRDLVSGLPKTITVTTEEVRKAIEEPVNSIVDAVTNTLDATPPELSADIVGRHHGQGHRAGRRWRQPAGPGRAAQARDEHAHPHHRRPPQVGRPRIRQVPRGVRDAEAGPHLQLTALTAGGQHEDDEQDAGAAGVFVHGAWDGRWPRPRS